MKIVILHESYDCDTGCCGHVIEVDGKRPFPFQHEHPYGKDFESWAKELVEEAYPGHSADLDFSSCIISDD